MPPHPLFRIPVYGRSRERHTEIFQTREDRAQANRVDRVRAIGGDPSLLRDLGGDPPGWYPWRFNDTIAWIEVQFDGLQLRGYLYKRADRLPSTTYPNGAFRIAEESGLVDNVARMPRTEIFADLLEGLEDLCRECDLSFDHADLAGLDILVANIDWASLADAITA